MCTKPASASHRSYASGASHPLTQSDQPPGNKRGSDLRSATIPQLLWCGNLPLCSVPAPQSRDCMPSAVDPASTVSGVICGAAGGCHSPTFPSSSIGSAAASAPASARARAWSPTCSGTWKQREARDKCVGARHALEMDST